MVEWLYFQHSQKSMGAVALESLSGEVVAHVLQGPHLVTVPGISPA